MPALGPWELVIILLIVVVIFGAGRLAEIGGAVGKSVREFRSATQDDKDKAAAAAAAANAPLTPVQTTTTTTPATTAPTATGTTVENKCPSCGTVNPASQVFCGQCGTRLTRAA
ncbi:MAG TPA: twin-arginine translocase TatA/TatE family subunit [Chloroflexota bacterium]|jgi:sec-independent protein translocase protein TatA